MTLETGIFISQAIWLWRVRHVRREAKKASMTYDQYIAKHPTKKISRCESQETIADIEACNDTKNSVVYTERQMLKKEKCLESELGDSESKLDIWEKDPLQKPPSAIVKP